MNRIVLERKRQNLTQEELAEKLNISQKSISKYETGARKPSFDTLTQMAKLFDVSTDYLLGVTESRKNNKVPFIEEHDSSQGMAGAIKYWIFKSGFGYDELAEKLGISEKLLEKYCSRKEDMPLHILVNLSQLCNVSTDCLLGIREKSRRPDPDGELPFRFDPEISRRLKEQAQQMDETYSFIADILGIDEDEVFNFFEYGFVPHISVFIKIVEHFLVSSDYLLNRTDSSITVEQGEEKILKAYRTLNDEYKSIAYGEILKLKKEHERESYLNANLSVAADKLAEESFPKTGTDGLGK